MLHVGHVTSKEVGVSYHRMPVEVTSLMSLERLDLSNNDLPGYVCAM